MIITFQAQIDPISDPPREFTCEEQLSLADEFKLFLSTISKFREYVRGDMYVNGEQFTHTTVGWVAIDYADHTGDSECPTN